MPKQKGRKVELFISNFRGYFWVLFYFVINFKDAKIIISVQNLLGLSKQISEKLTLLTYCNHLNKCL